MPRLTKSTRLIDLTVGDLEYLVRQWISGNPEQPIEALGQRPEGMTDVKIIEAILREHGPLHVSEIVRLGREQGVSFRGNKPPTQMARDKMYASKRFTNQGGNIWTAW